MRDSILACPLSVLLLAGCDDPSGKREVIEECVGLLTITAPVDSFTERVRIVYDGREVANDCATETPLGPVEVIRSEDELVLEDGGLGYTPPPTVSLAIFDQGDCTGAEELLVAVTARAVPGAPFELCENARLDL